MAWAPSLNLNKKLSLFESYLLSSVACSLILWFGLFFTTPDFFPNSFFFSFFVVGHWLFFASWPFKIRGFKSQFHTAGLFLFQVISLVGMSFSINNNLMLVLALVPCVCGSFYFLYLGGHLQIEDKSKGPGLFLIGVLSYVIFGSIGQNKLLSTQDILVYSSLTVWVSLLSYWASLSLSRSYKSLIFNVFRRSKEHHPWEENGEEENNKERLFFHDLINQTHGMSLFLNGRTSKSEGLSLEESKSFEREVKALQSLIEDYYGYKHKNLVNTFGIVDFELVKGQIIKLISNYLNHEHVDTHVLFKGGLSDTVPESKRKECKIHFASFYRILTNLVKNVSENNPSEVEFSFDFENTFLTLTVKNKVLHLKEDQGNLAKRLEGIILETSHSGNRNTDGSGLGLESISTMCEESGGNFKFLLDGDYWVNIVTLPNASVERAKKVAA